MKLIIHEYGEPEVGIYPSTKIIECPFDEVDIKNEEVTPQDLEDFRERIKAAYEPFLFDLPTAEIEYDFEVSERMKKENEYLNQS